MIWGRSEFSGPQQPHEQLLRVRLGTVGSCASNQMGSSKPKTPGEQTRAMGSGWQMRQSHHGQPSALQPPPHRSSSSGSPGPEAGEAWAWAPHTCEVQGRAPPQNCCCRRQTLDFSLGMMTVPRCSGPSHLLREQAELFPFFFPL